MSLDKQGRPYLTGYLLNCFQRVWMFLRIILALLDKYELGGLQEVIDPAVFRVSPFREMGEVRGVVARFGGDARRLRDTVDEIQRRLYA